MKINLSRKIMLGGAVTLSALGGFLTHSCIKSSQTNESDEEYRILSELTIISADSSKEYDAPIESANEYFIKAREKEIADSTEFMNNPCKENIYKYKNSTQKVNTYRKLINFLENKKAQLAAEEINKGIAIKVYPDSLN